MPSYLNSALIRSVVAAWFAVPSVAPPVTIVHEHIDGDQVHLHQAHHRHSFGDAELHVQAHEALRSSTDRHGVITGGDYHLHAHVYFLGWDFHVPLTGPDESDVRHACLADFAVRLKQSVAALERSERAAQRAGALGSASSELVASAVCTEIATEQVADPPTQLCDRARHQRSRVQLC